jgi:hypothetical protein
MNLRNYRLNRVQKTLGLVLLLALAAIPLRATSVVPPEFSELVNRSDYVVRARVKSLSYEERVSGGRELIFTKIEVEVLEVIAGTPPAPVVLVMLGGKNGDRELVVAGVPQFRVGDEEILFVEGNGRNFYPLYAVMHGKYPVKRDPATGRRFVTRSNEVPLGDVAEVTLPMTDGTAAELQKRMRRTTDAMTPEDFIQRIKQQRGPKRAK